MHEDVMMAIWATMTSLYGKRWIDNYGSFSNSFGNVSDQVRVWAEVLAPIPPHRLVAALNECARRGSPFVPTLPEFVAMCSPRAWEKGLVL